MNNLLKKIATHQVKVRLEREKRKKLAAKKQTYFPLIEDHLVMMSTRKEAEKYLTKKYKLLFSNPGNQYTTKELMFRAMDRLHYEVNTKLTSHKRPFRFNWTSKRINDKTEEWTLYSTTETETETKELIKFMVSK